MTEFGTEAAVDIVVNDRSLREARDEIEEGLGDITVGVDGSGGAAGRAVSDGGVNASDAGSLAIQRDQNDRLEEIVELLEEGTGGGGRGGGGGTTILGGVGGGGAAATAAGAAGTAATVGGIVAGGIGLTALFADRMAELQQSPATDPIEGTTGEGAPAQAISDVLDGVVDGSGLGDFSETVDQILGDQMSNDPVVGDAPSWIDEFTSGPETPDWLRDFLGGPDKPEWVDSVTTNVTNRTEPITDEKRRQILRQDGDPTTNPLPRSSSTDPSQRGPPSLESVQTRGVERSLSGLQRELQRKFDRLEREIDEIGRAFG